MNVTKIRKNVKQKDYEGLLGKICMEARKKKSKMESDLEKITDKLIKNNKELLKYLANR